MKVLRAVTGDAVLFCWFLCALLLGTGCAATNSVGTPHLNTAEKMAWSTYAIGTKKGLATCVVVNRAPRPDGRYLFPVLITSAHVLSIAPHGPFYLIARRSNEAGDPDVLLVEIEPSAETEPAYVRHPLYDIAAIELPIPAEMAAQLTLPSFLNEKAIGRANDLPRLGEDVSLLGYPEMLPATQGGFAILRTGRIASYATGARGDRARFLVNTNVYPGDSGGPVFAARGRGRPRLLGIVTQRIGQSAGAMPLAVAIDAAAVRETLELLNEQEDRIPRLPLAARESPEPSVKPAVKLLGRLPEWLRKRAQRSP